MALTALEATRLPRHLDAACRTLNRVANAYWGQPDTCIASAAALRDVLLARGTHAAVCRVSAEVFPAERTNFGCTIGHDGDGTRRPAATPGYWRGHLVTIADGRWLLDPTLDQVNAGNPLLVAEPFIGELPYGWANGAPLYGLTGELGSWVRYKRYPRQNGYATAGAYRLRYRAAVIALTLEALGPTARAGEHGAAADG